MTSIWEKIRSAMGTSEREVPENVRHQIRLATGALLLEMCRADFKIMPQERRQIAGTIRKTFGLSEAETHDLLDNAETQAECSVSLQIYTSLINQYCNKDQKSDLVRDLWRVAYADGELHKLEEVLVGRVSGLIGISHTQLAKLEQEVKSAASS